MHISYAVETKLSGFWGTVIYNKAEKTKTNSVILFQLQLFLVKLISWRFKYG